MAPTHHCQLYVGCPEVDGATMWFAAASRRCFPMRLFLADARSRRHGVLQAEQKTQTLGDAELETRLYRPAVPRAARHLEPDYAYLHQELKRPGVTL